MKIFGYTVSIRKTQEQSVDVDLSHGWMDGLIDLNRKAHNLKNNLGLGPSMIKTISRLDPVRGIVFPEPNDLNDDFEVFRLQKLVNKTRDMFTKGRANICVVQDAVDEFNLTMTPRALEAFNKIRLIHMAPFTGVPESIVKQLPTLLTLVYTEGRYPLDEGRALEHGR